MMTGDKFETAENVAISCQLINPLNSLLRLKTANDFERMPTDIFGSIILEGAVVDHIMKSDKAA